MFVFFRLFAISFYFISNASFLFFLLRSFGSFGSFGLRSRYVRFYFRLFVFVTLFRLLMLSFFFLFRSFGSFGSAKCVTDNFFFSFVFSLLHSVLFCF